MRRRDRRTRHFQRVRRQLGSGTGNSTGTGTGNTVGTGTGNTGVTGTGGITPVDPTVCTPGVPTTSQIPRLTRAEYDKTTRDLLGLDVQPSQHAGARHARQRRPARLGRLQDGGRLAGDAGPGHRDGQGEGRCPARPTTPPASSSSSPAFGQKAFRRPLTTAEVTRFQNLYTNRATLTQNGTFDQAVTAIIKAFLMSPSFLSKTETSTAMAEGSTVPGQQLGDGLAPLLHAVGHDAGRHAVHGRRSRTSCWRRRTSWPRRSGCCRTRGRA